jgi:hypothetical protein
MRTLKALACATALVAGVATSMAQSNVYSLNVVGYYNVPCVANQFVMVANQLNTTNNTIGALFPSPVPSTILLKFNGSWTQYQFDPDDLVWYPDANATMNVGEAALVKSPSAATLTFVGEVLQGNLSNPFAAVGTYGARASMVPQAGLVTTDLQFPAQPSDIVLKFVNGWTQYQYDPDDLVFYPNEPTFGVGEGMLIKKAGATSAWTRSFTVQ